MNGGSADAGVFREKSVSPSSGLLQRERNRKRQNLLKYPSRLIENLGRVGQWSVGMVNQSPADSWQRTLYVLWIGEFLIAAGTNLVIPFLPIYIQSLGIHQTGAVEQWSGLVFSSTFITSIVAQPIWGRLADRVGRKIMLVRSGIGMGIVMAASGMVHAVWQLMVLRALMGTVSGFIGAAVALQASQTPRENAGRALGTLQTGAVSGMLVGPLIGGILAESIGIRRVFFVTGGAEILAAVLVILYVHETFTPVPANVGDNLHALFRQLAASRIILPLFMVSALVQTGYLSIEPIVTIFVRQLNPGSGHLATLAGATFAAIGIGNMISAPWLGRLADRVGSQKVLWWSLMAAALLYIPQAFVHSAYQLMGLRLLLGLSLGGLQPSVQSLIRRHTPRAQLGRIFGFNTSFMMLGNLIGPTMGGFLSSSWGIPSVFFISSVIMAIDAFWVFVAIIRPGSKTVAPTL